MKTKTMKILTMLVTIVLLVGMGSPMVFAAGSSKKTTGTAAGTAAGTDSAITPETMKSKTDYSGVGDISTIGGKVMGIINTFGVVVAVVVLMVLGIKYMMGSAEEKAEYKKTMIPYVIGAVLIFAATTIANAVYNFANGI